MAGHLSRLTLKLKVDASPERLRGACLGPYLQGVLMETVSSDYAAGLHRAAVNPYSQHAVAVGEGVATPLLWQVCALTDDAYDNLVVPVSRRGFSAFHIRQVGATATVAERTLERVGYAELTALAYAPAEASRFRVHFVTPTAFKQAGEYVFWPEPRLVFQSLALKFGAVVDQEEPETGLVDEFAKSVRVTSYRVASQQFGVGQARVPGFTGAVTFSVRGAETFKSYIAALLRFGEFSGCGIKSSMGMGAMRVQPLPPTRKGKVEE